MDVSSVTILGVVILLLLILAGMPIAFALALSGFIGLAILRSMGVAFDALGVFPFGRVLSFLLTLIPMFILMGQLAYAAGLSQSAYNAGNKWLGHIPGGLGIATVTAGAAFGACCGSSIAASAALGKATIPEMRRFSYNRGLACGTVASAGLLSSLIPPSLGFVFYGVVTGASIGKLLISGIIPGIITATSFAFALTLIALRRPNMAPRGVRVGMIFIVVLGGIYGGVFTATEAGALGATLAMLIAVTMVLRKRSRWNDIKEACLETVNTTAMVFALLIGAGIFSLFLAMSGLGQQLGQLVSASGLSPLAVIVIICLIYLPLGMFLDPASLTIITAPIFYPIVIALGFNGIWFGVILIKMIEISLLTPPVGLNVYVVKGIVPDVPLEDIFKGVAPFLIMEAIVLILLIAFPQIALWLPGTMK
jgi:tripartite ATP-independent transporter DctM subunit